MRHNLGFTIWRYRKRSPNCCCACYYQKRFQCLCKSLPCQVGVVEVALGVPRCPSPQLVCRVQRSSLGMGLVFGPVEQDQTALEDTVSKILSVECRSAPISLKDTKCRVPVRGGTGFLQKISADLCRQLTFSY